jgi:hypothetical protein
VKMKKVKKWKNLLRTERICREQQNKKREREKKFLKHNASNQAQELQIVHKMRRDFNFFNLLD